MIKDKIIITITIASVQRNKMSSYALVRATKQRILLVTGKRCNSHTIRHDTRCYFNVQSKADMSQLNLPHGTNK